VIARLPFLLVLPRWIASWIVVELLPALRDPVAPLLGLWRRDVRVQRGCVFGRAGRRRLRLDIYRQRGTAAAPRPAIVNVHGGGWVIGSRREQGRPLLCHLAARGWVGFNVDYRLCPGVSLEEQVYDVKRAIAWIRDHAHELGVDPTFIAVTGGSAGGHLSALVALTAADRSFQPGFESADTSVQAAIPCYGVYELAGALAEHRPAIARMVARHVVKADPVGDPQRFARLSPIARIHVDAPRFLVVHGDADSLFPVQEGRRFAAALWRVSTAPVRYFEAPGRRARIRPDRVAPHRSAVHDRRRVPRRSAERRRTGAAGAGSSPMSLVPNLGSVLQRVEQILPAVQDTLARIDVTLETLDRRIEHLDRIPELERELAALRRTLDER
jgi:acetyl esterase/lipase